MSEKLSREQIEIARTCYAFLPKPKVFSEFSNAEWVLNQLCDLALSALQNEAAGQTGQVVPQEWVMVPREPTIPMVKAGAIEIHGEPGRIGSGWGFAAQIYRAMLSAAQVSSGKKE